MTAARFLRGQLVALAVIGFAVGVRYALDLVWPVSVVPFATFFPAILVAGYFGGLGGCITGIVLSILAGWYFFLPPKNSFAIDSQADIVNLVLFAGAIASIGALAVLLQSRVAFARRVEARLHRAHLAGGAADWEWDVGSDQVVWSPALYALHGLPVGDLGPSSETVFRAMHPDDLPHVRRTLAEARDSGKPLVMEYRVVHSDGAVRWLLSRAEMLPERVGKSRKMVGVNIDITTHKDAERQRELMFHELNHRVKNNFQVVASLLRMQAGRVGDSAAREHLNNAMRRVLTMADVHGSLYKAGHIDTVDFADYMRDLCEKISNSMLLNTRVKCHVRAETAVLKVDRAIPLGLVVNELVMNSIKHGFPGGAEGEIHVTFGPSDGKFLLSVTDNGIGLPLEATVTGAGFSGSESGLGMRLIEAFSQQAGGELKYERGRKGAQFEIWLPSEIFVVSDIGGAEATKAANGNRS